MRHVAGVMSGTSLDGIDVAVAQLCGSGADLQMETKAYAATPLERPLRDLLLEAATADKFSVSDLCQANVRLAHAYADAIRTTIRAAELPLASLDLVGSHGQTVRHLPQAADCAGMQIASTLQIGDPSVLANLLGVPVVGDFRLADMALGGQGAPLAPYFDYVVFADPVQTRGLLNLGGIANLTVLPAGGGPLATYGFDTGPANMVIDALAQRLFGIPYDQDGRLAAAGQANLALLRQLLRDPYFALRPPKSTGRERFGAAFVDKFLGVAGDMAAEDLMATATMLTVESVYDAYARFAAEKDPLDVLILSGGGQRNEFLARELAKRLDPVPTRSTDEYGIATDAKEALCFAVLAHETFSGNPTNLPSVTGASHPTLLGKICLPG